MAIKIQPVSLFPKLPKLPEPTLTPVGVVTHYYDKIKVAAIKLGAGLQVGARLQLIGEKGPFQQRLNSMQINREPVKSVRRGEEIGIKVKKKVIAGEIAYRID